MAKLQRTCYLFLRCMSTIYMFAFLSFYVQIPGLYGNNGILPARMELHHSGRTLEKCLQDKPTFLWLAPYLGLDTEYMMDVVSLIGIFLSFGGFVSSSCCTAPMFLVLWSLYFSLFQVGQTFLHFQWDILLLEAGFVAIIVAPVSWKKLNTYVPRNGISLWLVRWLLFRLMFASGVVKLTSRCPTWWGLTALNVHYESQCIPTPVAWYAHQLPSWFHRLSVIGTYVIEIFIPFLFFAPVRSVRIFCFYSQVLLQLLIILTGNYNFFNILTIVLCISLIDDDFIEGKEKTVSKVTVSRRIANYLQGIFQVIVYGGIIYWTFAFFSLRVTVSGTIESEVSFTHEQFNSALARAVPFSIGLGLVSLGLTVAEDLVVGFFSTPGCLRKLASCLYTYIHALIVLALVGITLVPYSVLDETTNRSLPSVLHHWYDGLDRYQITNQYGLFRRMTGVGGRPEVIMEGSMKS